MNCMIESSKEYIQGTEEWFELRKTKITATDSSVIMESNPWKTKTDLYYEKISDNVKPLYTNEAMQRGIDLEPIARDLFNLKTGLNTQPIVFIKDWAMASLDGRDDSTGCIVEIKCPGPKDHSIAISGNVPDHYFPQLQHQMYVCGVQFMYYFSFDGADGVIVKVKRDDQYIEKMVEEELKFYRCLTNKSPPEPSEGDYIQRSDEIWEQCALKWKSVAELLKELEKEEESLRQQLIFLSGESNTKGSGIALCQVQRKGNVEYPKIPELSNVDLEKYRKPSSTSWRINLI